MNIFKRILNLEKEIGSVNDDCELGLKEKVDELIRQSCHQRSEIESLIKFREQSFKNTFDSFDYNTLVCSMWGKYIDKFGKITTEEEYKADLERVLFVDDIDIGDYIVKVGIHTLNSQRRGSKTKPYIVYHAIGKCRVGSILQIKFTNKNTSEAYDVYYEIGEGFMLEECDSFGNTEVGINGEYYYISTDEIKDFINKCRNDIFWIECINRLLKEYGEFIIKKTLTDI